MEHNNRKIRCERRTPEKMNDVYGKYAPDRMSRRREEHEPSEMPRWREAMAQGGRFAGHDADGLGEGERFATREGERFAPSRRHPSYDTAPQSKRPPTREPLPQNKSTARRRLPGGMLAVILLPIMAVAVLVVLLSNTSGPQAEPSTYTSNNRGAISRQNPSSGQDSPTTLGSGHHANGNTYTNGPDATGHIPLTRIPITDIQDTGYLALVNRQHAIQQEPYRGLLTGAWPTVAVSRVDDMYLHKSALRAVSEMFATARQHDIAAFFVSSGFRSYYAQTNIYGDGSNSAFVQPPGHSEHHTGLAADILAPGIGMEAMANSPEGEWLAANSYRYGLILRYPEGATEITGIEFEPWHFRYVGQAHAYFMKQSGFVLEEYIAYIRSYEHISFDKDGRTYFVMHKIPEDGMIYVPYELEYMVSADNKGGYIVLAWD